MPEVRVFVFSSKNITNIWAGYGAKLWAVSAGTDVSSRKGKVTKASKMPIGSFGLLYCESWRSFTVPFVVSSSADPERVESEVWEGDWILPFSFRPLGSPRKRLSGIQVRNLPGAKAKGVTNYGHYLKLRGDFAFQASLVDEFDWQEIVRLLV